MQIRPVEFDEAAKRLEPLLIGLPFKIVAVDGRAGAGKTSLARFLAWYFNSSMLELDLFITGPGLQHHESEVRRIIEFRRKLRRPVIVEGLTVLQVLEAAGVQPDFVIHVRNTKHPSGFGVKQERDKYEGHYAPEARADYIVEVGHDG